MVHFSAFVRSICFSGKKLCYHAYLSVDPFLHIVASLRAMQCVKLRV